MRCREARNRLTELNRESGPDLDKELLKHLAECPECAQYAEATGTLGQMFTAAAENDTNGVIPQSVMQGRVEARLSERKQSVPHRLWWLLWHRPRYGVGLVVTAAVLALVSLVPFGYDRIVGYNLAVDGVSREVAEDDEAICDVFYQLGVFDAAVDVTGCDTTCHLLIFDLRSSDEIRKVMAALGHLGEESVTTDVIPVTTRSSGSLLAQANQRIFTN